MYADDAAIFLKPTVRDVTNMKDLLMLFGDTTGLSTNISKTSVTPISCSNIDLNDVLTNFPVNRQNFPIKYLGLPLATRQLKRLYYEPLVDRTADKLCIWNGRNLTQAGRVALAKSVLSSQPIYLLTALKPPREVLEDVDQYRKSFTWAGNRAISGGKCKVNWTRTTLPKPNGGLGILNLDKFASALHVRWLWLEWVALEKAWVGTETPCDEHDRLFFAACSTISIGNGERAKFWTNAWLNGRRPKDIAPGLFARTKKTRRKQ